MKSEVPTRVRVGYRHYIIRVVSQHDADLMNIHGWTQPAQGEILLDDAMDDQFCARFYCMRFYMHVLETQHCAKCMRRQLRRLLLMR